MLHIVSFSGGKDSTAMLLMMLERKMPIDHILFCDTGKEFDELYDHVDKVERYIGRPITRLKAEHGYEYYLYQHEKVRGKYKGECGHGWSSMLKRWCTNRLKQVPIREFYKSLNVPKDEKQEYIGIAVDEPKRLKEKPNTHYPLAEWNVTEKEALQYCYDKGFDFGGLYKVFNRLGCWLCPLQSMNDLYSLYKYHPDKWAELLQIEKDMYANIKWNDMSKILNFKNGRYSVAELDAKFKREAEQGR